MKSKMFKDWSMSEESSKEFKKDLKRVVQLSKEKLLRFLETYKNLLLTKVPSKRKQLIESTTKELNIEESDFNSVYGVADYFFERFLPDTVAYKDDPKDMADDLIELGYCSLSEKEGLSIFLEGLNKMVKMDLDFQIHKEKALSKGAPIFKSASTSVNFRAIFKGEGLFGDPATNYRPDCIGVVPVATINLILDNCFYENISFQCDIERLIFFKETINQTLIEIEEAKKFLKLEGINEKN